MSKLFTPYQIKNLELKNRVVMAPMCMFSADTNGHANDWHFTHYAARAVGGVGLIILEATAVEARGRISEHDLGIWKEEQVEGLKKIVDLCKAHGSKVGIQLGHAGRKSEAMSEPNIGPSAIAYSDDYRVPVEMTKEDIKNVAEAFKEAARRADLAGFDTIELHGAHGYLINQFLSPLTNKRTDEYGGNAENRSRFLKEILQAIKTVWPEEKPVILRVSAEEYGEEGNHDVDVANMIKDLKEEGLDLINVSSGGVINVVPKAYPGYQVKFAETIKQITGLPVMAGGLISSPSMAEEIVQNERTDFIFLGRELLRNPYWCLQAAKELRDEITWPKQYERAKLK
ncbi:NADPH dehydrogenase NamA [Anaerocolumna aminovalerica]|uniref:NADPH dehydrogenase NamA n=1 Tax=Anaerocolumna aminovalerica TaxID=1527 RepID=UPI001C0EA9F6|nr:NADPH dehydrogenase NamA [Anaerocolumna aminovalerica]MBU5331183.1 NADPH dehydrogenase NamA [Anaerocolumna aminovalerica]